MCSLFYLRTLHAPWQRSGSHKRPKTSFVRWPPAQDRHSLRGASWQSYFGLLSVLWEFFLAMRAINVDMSSILRSTKNHLKI